MVINLEVQISADHLSILQKIKEIVVGMQSISSEHPQFLNMTRIKLVDSRNHRPKFMIYSGDEANSWLENYEYLYQKLWRSELQLREMIVVIKLLYYRFYCNHVTEVT